MSDLEQQIVNAGADKAPRIIPDHIKSKIIGAHYFTALDGVSAVLPDVATIKNQEVQSLSLLTICVLVLENGFTVTGESACASPENFNEEIGRKIAYENAIDKVWLLEGYVLKQNLHEKAESQAMLASFAENNKCEGGGCTI